MMPSASMVERAGGLGRLSEMLERIGDTEGEDRLGRALGWSVPLLVLMAFAVALAAAPPPNDVDLMLAAPDRARPGATLPLRALALTGVADPAGSSTPLHRAPTVRLIEPAGAEVGRVTLATGAGDTYEGELRLPRGGRGTFTLEARLVVNDEPVVVRRLVEVGPDVALLAPSGRLANAAQRYRPDPVRRVAGQRAPSELDLRVLGGACAPELPCELRIWVGEPAAAVQLEARPTLEVRPAEASPETAGIVSRVVIVRSAEALAHVVATRGGVEVARRDVQLPVLMAGHALQLPDGPVASAPALPTLVAHSLDDRRTLFVDAFRAGAWLHTGSLTLDGSLRGRLPFALEPGLWRLEVHGDAFATLRAATRALLVLEPGADPAASLRDLAADARELTRPDPLGSALVSGRPPAAPVREQAELLLAFPELDFFPLPELAHSTLQATPDEDPVRRALRIGAAALVLLAGVVLAWLLVRRGRAAERQAEVLAMAAEQELFELGEATPPSEAPPSGRSRGLYAAAAFVVLAFGLAALLVVARGCIT